VLAEAADAPASRAQEIRLRYVAIVESSDDAIIAKTLDGVISAWNAATTDVRIYGARGHRTADHDDHPSGLARGEMRF
jgi:PAS domain-containing protein